MKTYLRISLLLASLALAACGNSGHDAPQAQRARATIVSQAAGTNVFIRTLSMDMQRYAELASVSFSIAPRPGTFARPVSATIEKTWFDRKGAYDATTRQLKLPVFGLYASWANVVSVTSTFTDGSTHTDTVTLETAAYTGPEALYNAPDVLTARNPAQAVPFDFIHIHNNTSGPVVIDTDGNLRWVAPLFDDSIPSLFTGDGFYVGNGSSPTLYRLELDGTFTTTPLASTTITDFHHALAPGKTGLLAQVDAVVDGVKRIESILVEIAPDGQVLKQWDMSTIFRDFMRAGGDDPSRFVRDGDDWFHMNSVLYDPADDSLLVSSRENFVVKLDYASGAIKWLFGDPAKYWYLNFPSLRAPALQMISGRFPIGQHSPMLVPGGVLLFNNGTPSIGQPPGAPLGNSLDSSAPTRYAIDELAKTVTSVWTYEHVPTVYSQFCSSVVQAGPDSYLVAYAMAAKGTRAKLTAIDTAGNVAFEYEYPTSFCDTIFRAAPVPFEALRLR
jgi:outer membrane protein assembly factor BamB